jgi:hypothetical protein
MKKEDIQVYRRERLDAAAVKIGGKAELGRRLGFKDGAFIGQMSRGERPVTEDTVLAIEALPGMRGWFSASATPSVPADRVDIVVQGIDGPVTVIELKNVSLGEHTLSPDELQDLLSAAIDLPLPKARELIAQMMLDAQTARTAAMQYLARHGVHSIASNERVAEKLPSAAGLPPPVPPRKSHSNVASLPPQGIASKGPRLKTSTTMKDVLEGAAKTKTTHKKPKSAKGR